MRTLESLAECRKPPGYRETIVVENGPKHGVAELVAKAPKKLFVRYLYEERGNKSLALNRVLSQLDDCLIFFADDDVRFHPGVLCAYADAAREHPTNTYFGGPTCVDYEEAPPAWLKRYLPHSARGMCLGDHRQKITSPVFLGFNWAAFARDLKAAEGFDYRKGPGSPTGSVGQETDMQRRLLGRDMHGLYLPEAVVWHYVPKSRCSPEWTLERAYRNGLCFALTAGPRESHSIKLPAGHAARLMRCLFAFAVTRFRSNSESRFYGSLRLRWATGYIRGSRTSTTKMPPLPLKEAA
jgi:GT2 family glycosyltransferase